MANSTGQIGVGHILEIAARNQWMFRPQPIDDIGIDAHMEQTEPTGKSKQLLAVQIKSGEVGLEKKKMVVLFFEI